MRLQVRYLLWPAGRPEQVRSAEDAEDAFIIQNAMAMAQLKATSSGRRIRVVRTDGQIADPFAIEAALSRSDAMLRRAVPA